MKYLNRKFQQGGQVDQQQITQQIADALQKGSKPEELVKTLMGIGMPQEQAVQLIQSVIQQMQGTPSAKNGAKLEFIQHLKGGNSVARQKIIDKTLNKVQDRIDQGTKTARNTWDRTDFYPTDFTPGRRVTTDYETLMDAKNPIIGTSLPYSLQRRYAGRVQNRIQTDRNEAQGYEKEIAQVEPLTGSPKTAKIPTATVNKEVQKWQKILIAEGFDLGKGGSSGKGDDGKWGPKTEKAYQAYMKNRETINARGSVDDHVPFVDAKQGFSQIATSLKQGGYLQKSSADTITKKPVVDVKVAKKIASKVVTAKPNKYIKAKTPPNDGADYVIPTKDEGGIDMNPTFWKKETPKITEAVKKKKSLERGGYLKKGKETDSEMMKKGSSMKNPKAKKCLKGCGCGTKLHKQGGILSTVCSCCGSMCN